MYHHLHHTCESFYAISAPPSPLASRLRQPAVLRSLSCMALLRCRCPTLCAQPQCTRALGGADAAGLGRHNNGGVECSACEWIRPDSVLSVCCMGQTVSCCHSTRLWSAPPACKTRWYYNGSAHLFCNATDAALCLVRGIWDKLMVQSTYCPRFLRIERAVPPRSFTEYMCAGNPPSSVSMPRNA